MRVAACVCVLVGDAVMEGVDVVDGVDVWLAVCVEEGVPV